RRARAVRRGGRTGCQRGQAERDAGHQGGQGERAGAVAAGTVLATLDALHGRADLVVVATRWPDGLSGGMRDPIEARVCLVVVVDRVERAFAGRLRGRY